MLVRTTSRGAPQENVLYLIWLTRISSRACSVALLLWLTAAWSFPTCCWSMTASPNETGGAHHHAPQAADPHAGHGEHHQSSTLTTAASAPASLWNTEGDCAAERDVAIIATGTTPTFKPVLASGPAAPFVIRTHAMRPGSQQAQLAPPGSPGVDFAFLNPLRI